MLNIKILEKFFTKRGSYFSFFFLKNFPSSGWHCFLQSPFPNFVGVTVPCDTFSPKSKSQSFQRKGREQQVKIFSSPFCQHPKNLLSEEKSHSGPRSSIKSSMNPTIFASFCSTRQPTQHNRPSAALTDWPQLPRSSIGSTVLDSLIISNHGNIWIYI